MKKHIFWTRGVTIIILMLFGLSYRSSAQLVTGINYTLEYSDNINQEPDKESAFINRIGLNLSSSRRSSFIESMISGSLGFETYSNSDQDAQLVPDLHAMVSFKFSPRLRWIVEDNIAQVSQQSSLPNVPSNQEFQNVFSTGPDLLFQVYPDVYLGYGLRYGNYYFSQTSEDSNQRISNALRLMHAISNKTTISLNSIYQNAFFNEDPDNNDFDRLDLFLGLARIDQLTSFRISAGQTFIDQKNQDVPDSVLFCVSVNRLLTSDSQIELRYSRQISELDFASNTGCDVPSLTLSDPLMSLIGTTLASNSATNRLFVEDTLEAAYTKAFKFSTVTLNIVRKFGDNQQESGQSDQNGVGLSFGYPIAENQSVGLGVFYNNQDDFDEISASVNYSYFITQRIGLAVGYTYTQTDYSGGLQTGSANENRAFISLIYRR